MDWPDDPKGDPEREHAIMSKIIANNLEGLASNNELKNAATIAMATEFQHWWETLSSSAKHAQWFPRDMFRYDGLLDMNHPRSKKYMDQLVCEAVAMSFPTLGHLFDKSGFSMLYMFICWKNTLRT